jgi:hypothetical protein
MSLLNAMRSRRTIAGGLALAAGTAAIASPVVAPPLSADPIGAPIGNGGNGGAGGNAGLFLGTGTYESCTALFGLTDKSNANYVVITVEGSASPRPVVGEDLIPVLTLAGSAPGGETECVPEVGFDDEASWVDYVSPPGPIDPELETLIAALFPYPGGTGYLVPNNTPGLVQPITSSIRFERAPSLATEVTASWDPSDLEFVDPDLTAVAQGIVDDALGGPTSPLGGRLLEYILGSCTEPTDAVDQELAAALADLTGAGPLLEAFYSQFVTDTCAQIEVGFLVIVQQAEVGAIGTDVTVTANGTGPGPTPGPDRSPAPVTPTYTG